MVPKLITGHHSVPTVAEMPPGTPDWDAAALLLLVDFEFVQGCQFPAAVFGIDTSEGLARLPDQVLSDAVSCHSLRVASLADRAGLLPFEFFKAWIADVVTRRAQENLKKNRFFRYSSAIK